MEKINQTIFDSLQLYSRTKGPAHPVIGVLEGCEVGEGVILKASEWDRKSKPDSYIGAHYRNDREGQTKKFTTRKLADGSGWAILRIQ